MSDNHPIRIAAALITDTKKNVLLVRKKNTAFFIQPGGKIEAQESAEEALIRELAEELNIALAKEDLVFLGQFNDVAINEKNRSLSAHIFSVTKTSLSITPAAEIEEAVWLSPAEVETMTIAPLTKNQLLPLVWDQDSRLESE